MSEKAQLKGGICKLNFGYNAKMEVYAALMSDINELYTIYWIENTSISSFKRRFLQ